MLDSLFEFENDSSQIDVNAPKCEPTIFLVEVKGYVAVKMSGESTQNPDEMVLQTAAKYSPDSPLSSSSSPCTVKLSKKECQLVRCHVRHRLVTAPFPLLPGRARASDASTLRFHSLGHCLQHLHCWQ